MSYRIDSNGTSYCKVYVTVQQMCPQTVFPQVLYPCIGTDCLIIHSVLRIGQSGVCVCVSVLLMGLPH